MPGKFSCAHCSDQYLYSDLRVNPKASMGRREKAQGTNMYLICFSNNITLATVSVKSLPRITMSSNTFRTTGVCRPSDYRQTSAVWRAAGDPHPNFKDTGMVQLFLCPLFCLIELSPHTYPWYLQQRDAGPPGSGADMLGFLHGVTKSGQKHF